ncbi:MAG: hypothetical protein NPIRA02_17720 [Nitrospirales bacterium]|nr:MAG: hypothetical protein NPIRA02_17720 [Nitrospirales bacterium]
MSSEGTYELTIPELKKGQVLTATQTLNRHTSQTSVPISVQEVTLSEIEIHPVIATMLEEGQSLPYMARGIFSNGKMEAPLAEVTWSTTQPTVATINPDGIVTGQKVGSTIVQATREGIQSAEAFVTVKPRPPIMTSSLNAGDTFVSGKAIPSANIKIMINGVPLHTPVLANTEGHWQAETLSPLKAHDQISSAQIVNHIESADSIPVVVAPTILTHITLNPGPTTVTTLELGQTQRFTASGIYSNGKIESPMSEITWAILPQRVANIDANGIVTGLEAGTATVQAMREGVQSTQAHVTVKPHPPVVTPSLNAGDTRVSGMAAPSARIKVMVNGVPLHTPVYADAEGQWQAVTRSPLHEHDRVTSSQLVKHIQSDASIPVVVAPPKLMHITLAADPTDVTTIELGQSQRFTASGLFSNGRTETPMPTVTWESSPPTIATIDSDGVVTGIDSGTVTIRARWQEVQSAPVQLTVKPRPPVVLAPLKAGDTIIAGSAHSLANIQLLKNGIPLDKQIRADEQGQWQARNLSPLHENDRISSIQIVNNAHSKPATAINVLPNQPPKLTSIGDQTVAVGETLQIAPHALDPEGDALTFEVIKRPLPENSHMDEKAGLFTFTPTAEQVGKSTLTFSVSDGNSAQEETITLTITLPKSLVVLLESPDGTVGSIQVSNKQGSQNLNKAGEAISIGNADQALPEPFILDEKDILEAFKDALQAKPEDPVSYTLHFENDTKLSQASQLLLPEIFSVIAERTSPDISVIGHSDRAGSDEYNYQLSLRRATSVFDLFVATGINPQSIEVTSHGENNPIIKTPDGVSEPLNRRVEIIIR